MDFGGILSRAWRIIWRHKVLWIFGILASCGQGGSGGSGGGNTGYQVSQGEASIPPGVERFFYNLGGFIEQIQGWQIVLLILFATLVIFLLSALALSVSTVGRVGLIQGTVKVEEKEEQLSFIGLFEQGKPFFWRVLGLNLMISIAFTVITLIFLLPLIGITVLTFGVGLLCFIPLICLLIPLNWAIKAVVKQANIALVIEDLNIIESLQRGWEIFRQNLGAIIVMMLILGLGGSLVATLFSLPLILAVFPAIAGGLIGNLMGADSALSGSLVLVGLCFASYLPILILLRGVLQAYLDSAWTLTYLALTQATSAQPTK